MAAYWKIKEIVGTEHRGEPVRHSAASEWKDMISGSVKKKEKESPFPSFARLLKHTAAIATRSTLDKERKKVYPAKTKKIKRECAWLQLITHCRENKK